MNQTKSQKTTVTLVLAALFSALAYLTVFILRIPFVPAVGFLKYEAKDAVLALEALILGPLPAALSSFVISVIEMVTISDTGIIGAVMNFLSSMAFVLPVGLIYKYRRNLSGAVIGLLCSVVSETVVMLLWNYLISPLYMGISREAITKLLLPGFLPFNAVKSAINAAITFLLYKPIMTVLRKAGLLPKREAAASKSVMPVIVNVICAVILAAAILALLISRITQNG